MRGRTGARLAISANASDSGAERMRCTMVMRIRGRTARRIRCLAAQWQMTPEEVIEVVVNRYAAQLGIDVSPSSEAPTPPASDKRV